jgi:hypothetical protein
VTNVGSKVAAGFFNQGIEEQRQSGAFYPGVVQTIHHTSLRWG